MKQKLFSFFLAVLGMIVGMSVANAATFNDFEMDLRDANGGILTSDEVSAAATTSFGFTVAEGGAITRTSSDDENALGTITGKTGNSHGLQNFVATVKVNGQVKITMSTCSWGGDVTVKDGNNETVASFTTAKGEGGTGCYQGNGKDDANIISVNYLGDATTLTISGGAYVGYFAVEEVQATSATVSYSLGNVVCSGTILPTGGTYAVGDNYTIPANNYTLYKEGYTLTAWTDGTNNYSLGSVVTLQSDLALTPVFTQNTVSLDDRTEPVTLKWNFRRDQGAPIVQWQNSNGNIWVTQATINNETIDVPMIVNTNPGKFNNSSNTDCAQTNNGTLFTIPSCKGAVVSTECHNSFSITTTTIDGQTDYTGSGTTNISYEIANTAETIDIVIGDGSYYRYVQTVLPVVETRQASDLTLTSSATVTKNMATDQDLTSQITYTTSSTGAVSYESNNTGIATVDDEGVITAVGNGTATITVTQAADATYAAGSATVTVTVTGGTAPTINVAAILNNNAGTLITTDEINNKSTVNFGINASGARVAVDAQDKVATVSGKYHSEHGLTGLAFSVDVPGNVKISVGECTYSGKTITVKNSNNVTVASTTPEKACWKNSTSNVAILYYEGGATTLTISGMDYCPYVAVESVENVPELHTINYYNGSTLVSTSQVYDGTSLGTLPTPEYDSDSQYFVGWYSDADDMGTKAFASTVPAGDATYYAVFIDALTATAGYYTPTTAAELIGTINYANANASQNNPVKIFLKNGTYDLGSAAEITQLTGSYISLIGESLEGTVITNIPEHEGLADATLLYNKGSYNYLQDLTLHNNYPYGNSTGRAPSLKDEGNYTICKNVWLYSHQDTYYSHRTGGYFYFNGGKISGCVDYMCGQSLVYFDGVTLSNDDKTSYMTANSELYVFNNCIVENNGSNTYYWGRSWSTVNGGPRCIFINTTLKDNGSHLGNTRWLAAGMNDPYVTAGEYGTKNAAGTDITPSSNIVNFTSKSGNASFETILTAEQAANYTLANIFGEWGATAVADATQAEVSNVVLNGNTLTWEGSSDAYLIEKNGEFVALTSETSYTVDNALAAYTVRAANSRGGFGEAETSAVVVTFTISTGTEATNLVSMGTCNLSAINSFMHILATKADGENTGKQDLSVKLQCKTAETEAAEVQFYVPEGFKFVPYSASVKVQPVGNDAYVKLELSDTGAGTTKISGSAESLPAGEITTVTLNMTEKYELESGVSLKLYCYDGGSTGVTQFRLGTPMTITGMLQPDVLTLTTTHNMEGYKAFYPGMANYIADENTDVYIAKSVGEDKVVLKRIENKFIPTQTAVILKTTGVADEPTENAYYQMTLTRSTYIDNDVTDNLLYVTMGNGWEDFTNGVYRLGYKAGQGVGFYTWKDPSPDEGIIYINKPISGNAKLTFVFFDEEEEATGVNTVSEDGAAVTSEAYNAAGQRVNAAENGFIIVKGKKYVK